MSISSIISIIFNLWYFNIFLHHREQIPYLSPFRGDQRDGLGLRWIVYMHEMDVDLTENMSPERVSRIVEDT